MYRPIYPLIWSSFRVYNIGILKCRCVLSFMSIVIHQHVLFMTKGHKGVYIHTRFQLYVYRVHIGPMEM